MKEEFDPDHFWMSGRIDSLIRPEYDYIFQPPCIEDKAITVARSIERGLGKATMEFLQKQTKVYYKHNKKLLLL